MLRIKRLYLTFICLSAVFSSNVAGEADSLLVQAAICEKQAFDAVGPRQFNDAILAKASCYESAGCAEDALATLQRLRMFALSSGQRDSVVFVKARLSYEIEDYDSAMSYLQELGEEVEYVKPRLKNEYAAALLTIPVPVGFAYVGDLPQGLLYTALNAASVGWIVLQIASGCYVSGILGGAMALNVTFLGAEQKVASLLEKRNSDIVKQAKKQVLSPFFQASSEGRTAHPE